LDKKKKQTGFIYIPQNKIFTQTINMTDQLLVSIC